MHLNTSKIKNYVPKLIFCGKEKIFNGGDCFVVVQQKLADSLETLFTKCKKFDLRTILDIAI